MREAAAHRVDEQHAQVVRAVRLERQRRGVRPVAELLRDRADHLRGLLADVVVAVERLADRCAGHAAFFGDILDCDHAYRLL
ncbi:hypothetical protein SDC9_175504 [bioreactor metagenome]|uniref:Uncharacterized protein n=1 Tax=bioreactor metagenome TaxID=1076179 RepID=A0A645GMV3_9ZZZZ